MTAQRTMFDAVSRLHASAHLGDDAETVCGYLRDAVAAAEAHPDHPASHLVLELAEAVEAAEADIGGCRRQSEIMDDALRVVFRPNGGA